MSASPLRLKSSRRAGFGHIMSLSGSGQVRVCDRKAGRGPAQPHVSEWMLSNPAICRAERPASWLTAMSATRQVGLAGVRVGISACQDAVILELVGRQHVPPGAGVVLGRHALDHGSAFQVKPV